jgi:DNA-binding NarL/FixJ family response regulator
MNDEASSPREAISARILIADDHPLYREALVMILRAAHDLDVVGEAADGQEALELCRRLRPDVVLMDVRMPQMDGLAATRAIKQEFPRTIILMITQFEDTMCLMKAIRAGAAGYLLKTAPRQQIIDAIRGVSRGESPLNQELSMQLLRRLLDEEPKGEEPKGEEPKGEEPKGEEPNRPASHKRATLPETLTRREIEVLRLLAGGRTNHEIARSLLISLSTVKKHVHRVIEKLGVSDRTQAAVRAIELGLLPPRKGE